MRINKISSLSVGVLLLILCDLQSVKTWNILGYEFNSINPYCHVKECCNKDWIRYNPKRLLQNLTEHVFGQPLLQTAVNALSAHFNSYYRPSKALTLSFHGMTGTGKNYVSNFIADSMFAKGSKSRYVHHFIGRMHFSEERYVAYYKHQLYTWLKGNISDCGKQIFIFDEVDKIVPEVLDAIKPMIDYRDNVDGVDYSQAVFLFLSNTGADVINEHYHDLYIGEGRSREDLQMSDFETFIQKGAFNEKGLFARGHTYFDKLSRKILYLSRFGGIFRFLLNLGGFQHGDVIKNNLIDHYIPFLPLEEQHIVKCVRREFRVRGVLHPKEEHIKEVMKIIEWGPDNSKFFSKTGCKRLGPKVGLLVDKYYRHVTYRSQRDEF